MINYIKTGDRSGFKIAFEDTAQNYIRTKQREGMFCGKFLTEKTVEANSEGVQKALNYDGFYYVEEIEEGATAMQVSFRDNTPAEFVDGHRYTIEIGKVESKPVKKPEIELMVVNKLIEMIKVNNVEAICRTVDANFMQAVNEAINLTTHQIYHDGSSNGMTTDPFLRAKKMVFDMELEPVKWLCSTSGFTFIENVTNDDVGGLSGEIFTEGLTKKKLLGLPVETTIKTKLEFLSTVAMGTADKGVTGLTPTKPFEFSITTENVEAQYSVYYLFVAPEFLGKIIKVGTDRIWSQWIKDIFEWSSWRYIGLGFGDIRGLVRVVVKRK